MNGPVSPADLARRAASGAGDDTRAAADAVLTQLQQAVDLFVASGPSEVSDVSDAGDIVRHATSVDAALQKRLEGTGA